MFELKDSPYLLPVPYPDEHIFSILNRFFHRNNPAVNQPQTLRIFQGYANEVNPLNPIGFRLFHDPENVLSHTTYPVFLKFQDRQFRKRFEKLIKENYKGSYLYMMPQSYYTKPHSKGSYSVFYCPLCLQEALSTYNEGYLKIIHQVDGVLACPIHKVELVSIPLEPSSPFFVFNQSFLRNGTPSDSEELDLACYIAQCGNIDREEVKTLLKEKWEIDLTSLKEGEKIDRLFTAISRRFSSAFLSRKNFTRETIYSIIRHLYDGKFIHPVELSILLLSLNV